MSNGLVSHLEAKAEAEDTEPSQQPTEPDENEDNVEDDEGEAGEEESEDEDVRNMLCSKAFLINHFYLDRNHNGAYFALPGLEVQQYGIR